MSNSGITPYKEKSEDEVDGNQDDDFNSVMTLQSPYTPMMNRGGGREGAHISTNEDKIIAINKNSNSDDPESSDSSSCGTEKHSIDEFQNQPSDIVQSEDRNNNIYKDEFSCSDESTELKKQSMLESPSITLRHRNENSDSDDVKSERSKKQKSDGIDGTATTHSNRKLSFQKIKSSKSSSSNLNKKSMTLPGPLSASNFREVYYSDSDSDSSSHDGNVSNTSGLQFMSLLCVDEVSLFFEPIFDFCSFIDCHYYPRGDSNYDGDFFHDLCFHFLLYFLLQSFLLY